MEKEKVKFTFEGDEYIIKHSNSASNLYALFINNVEIMGSIYPYDCLVRLNKIINNKINKLYYGKS